MDIAVGYSKQAGKSTSYLEDDLLTVEYSQHMHVLVLHSSKIRIITFGTSRRKQASVQKGLMWKPRVNVLAAARHRQLNLGLNLFHIVIGLSLYIHSGLSYIS